MRAWWISVEGRKLAQGDLLDGCRLPMFADLQSVDTPVVAEGEVTTARLIVITQSCDLENNKAPNVAMCPIHRLDEFEAFNTKFARKGAWEQVRKGRVDALHMLASPVHPENNRESLVVDFGHIVSLPIEYLSQRAESLGKRWRLESPFLEHFSQAFARFFMRVGLPSGIAEFE